MTEQNPAGWLQNAGATHTAAQLRTYAGSLLNGIASSGAITVGRGGVHPGFGTQLVVTQNGTPNMSVNVGAGVVYVPGTESTAQGTYFCENDAVVNLSIATAPGAGQSRIDLVVAKVQDSQYSGATNAWSLAVVTGTASASPSAPSAPNNSVILAQIAVGSSVSSIVTANITDKRIFASALGAPLTGTSSLMPTATQLSAGQLVYQSDTNKFQHLVSGSYTNTVDGIILGGNIISQAHTQTGIGATETALDNYTTGSITLPASRYIRIEAWIPGLIFSASTGTALLRLRETNTSGTELQERLIDGLGSTFGSTRCTIRADISSGAGATKVYCATLARLAGTGTISANTGAAAYGSILVYDMGPISRVTVIT